MNKLLENIKTFGYKVPEDPEQLLYDFYFMAGWMPHAREDKVIDFVFKEALKDCTAALQEHMLAAIYWSLAAEIRHIFVYSYLRPGRMGTEKEMAKLPEDIKTFLKKYFTNVMKYGSDVLGMLDPDRVKTLAKSNRLLKHNLFKARRGKEPEGRNATYRESFLALESARKAMGWSKLEAVQALKYLYGDVTWDGSYGGDAWASIADAYIKLAQATTSEERVIYIDHAYDLQHNTGSVFTKVKNYYKNGGLSWLSNALDWKRDTKDIRSYYDKVSSSLRPVVAWVAKDKYGLTMEDYRTPREIDAAKRDAKHSATRSFVDSMKHTMSSGEVFSYSASSVFFPVSGLSSQGRRDLKDTIKKLLPNIQEPSTMEYLVSGAIKGWQILNLNSDSPVLKPAETARPSTPAIIVNSKDVIYAWKQLSALHAKAPADNGKLPLPEKFYINMAHLSQDGRQALMKKLVADVLPQGSRWYSNSALDDFDRVPLDEDVLVLTKYGEVYKAGKAGEGYISNLRKDGAKEITEEELLQGMYDKAQEDTQKVSLPDKFYVKMFGLPEDKKLEVLRALELYVLPSGSAWTDGDSISSPDALEAFKPAYTYTHTYTHMLLEREGAVYVATIGSLRNVRKHTTTELTADEILSGAYNKDAQAVKNRSRSLYSRGDRVVIRSDLNIKDEYSGLGVTPSMSALAGKVVTILEALSPTIYRIVEDNGAWLWAPEMFSGLAPDETTYKGGSAVSESRDFHEFFKLKEAVTMAQVGGKLLANASHFAKNMSLIQDFRISDLPAGVNTPEDLLYDLATSKARGRVLPDNVVEQLKNLQAKHGNLKAGISAWLKANPDANTILNELLRQGVTASTIQKADTGAVKRTGTAAQLQAVARR